MDIFSLEKVIWNFGPWNFFRTPKLGAKSPPVQRRSMKVCPVCGVFLVVDCLPCGITSTDLLYPRFYIYPYYFDQQSLSSSTWNRTSTIKKVYTHRRYPFRGSLSQPNSGNNEKKKRCMGVHDLFGISAEDTKKPYNCRIFLFEVNCVPFVIMPTNTQ